MFGKLFTLMVAVVSVVLLSGPASAEKYAPDSSTNCVVKITARPGVPISAFVHVKGDGDAAITGTVTISVSKGGSAVARGATQVASSVVWSSSMRYDGHPVRFTGPTLGPGHYRAVASFDADPGVYLDCDCFDSFSPSARDAVAVVPAGFDGGLPNTGGPSLWWLALGVGLVGAGGGAVYVNRRRRQSLA